MNIPEHLLACLSEEGGEVATEALELAFTALKLGKVATKALRFSLPDQLTLDPAGPPGTEGPTNAEKLHQEVIDLIAVYLMLQRLNVVPMLGITACTDKTFAAIEKKQAKVRAFMSHARRQGALETTCANCGRVPDQCVCPPEMEATFP